MREVRANTKMTTEMIKDKAQIVSDVGDVWGWKFHHYTVGLTNISNINDATKLLVEAARIDVIDDNMFDDDIIMLEPRKPFRKVQLKSMRAVAYGDVTYILDKKPEGGTIYVIVKGKVIDSTNKVNGVDLWDFSRVYQEHLISNKKQFKKR